MTTTEKTPGPKIYVEIDMTSMVQPPPPVDYAILCDRSPTFIRKFVANNPDCFVFPFFTQSIRRSMDFSQFSLIQVARPIFVGHLTL